MAHFSIGLFSLSLAGCATSVEGAVSPPRQWARAVVGESCGELAGTYSDAGDPASDNAHSWLYNVMWPVAGSLSAIIERGVNAPTEQPPATVTVRVSTSGEISFDGRSRAGTVRPLSAKSLNCEHGMLTFRTPLDAQSTASRPKRTSEAYLRLWKASDGALIAEQTIHVVKAGDESSADEPRPRARFYFHFEPMR